jgi:uncharacterized membrane protein
MRYTQFDIVDQAITNLLIGFGLALLNVLFCYFVKGAPRVIKVIPRDNQVRWLIFAYMIALIIQLATSPIFRSLLQSVYVEMAWSPFQAAFNVLGVIVLDVIILVVAGVRRGAEVASRGIGELGERASSAVESVGGALGKGGEGQQNDARPADQGEAQAESRKRLDDRLKDY